MLHRESRAESRSGSRILGVTALVCGLALAAPFWTGRLVPFLDLPQHLAIATVLHHHDDPASPLTRFFEAEWGEFTPYWFQYVVLHVLGYVMPIETAAKVHLTLYAVAFPWAAMALCSALGRPPWLGLLAAPLALNTNLYCGFVNYCTGVVLLLFALALFERHLQTPSPRRGIALALLAALLFFTHIQVFAFLLVAASAWALVHDGPRGLRERSERLLPVVSAGLLLFLPWLYFTLSGGTRRDFGSLAATEARFVPFLVNLSDFPRAVADYFQDQSDARLLRTWSLLWLALLLASVRKARTTTGSLLHRFRVEVLLVLALAAYFLAPFSIKGQWNINQRFALLAVLFAVAVIRRVPRPASLAGAALAVALVLATAANAVEHHRRFDEELGPFDEALETIPHGSRVLALMYDNEGRVVKPWPYLHMGQYASVRRGSVVSNSFGRLGPLPVRLRDDVVLPNPGLWTPHLFSCELHGVHYDYFLVRDALGEKRNIFGRGCSGVELVYRGGSWLVYGRTEPSPRR